MKREGSPGAMDVAGCDLPEDRLYDLENDVWWAAGPGGRTARLGVLASLASFAGRFQSVTFRPVDGVVPRGRSVATIESVRFTGAVRMPVDGRVVARNEELRRRPRTLNDAPYGDGWVVEVEPVDPAEAERRLAPAASVSEALEARVKELRIHCYPASPDVELIEVGTECAVVLSRVEGAFKQLTPGEIVLLVSDDATAPMEFVRWADRTGETYLYHRREGNLHHLLLRKEANPTPRRRGSSGAMG